MKRGLDIIEIVCWPTMMIIASAAANRVEGREKALRKDLNNAPADAVAASTAGVVVCLSFSSGFQKALKSEVFPHFSNLL